MSLKIARWRILATQWARHNNPPISDTSNEIFLLRFSQFLVLAVTGGCLYVGVQGMLQIAVEFDPVLLLPGNSYLRKFIDANDVNFTTTGETATIYTGPVNYTIRDFKKVDRIVTRLDTAMEEDGFLTGMMSLFSQRSGTMQLFDFTPRHQLSI